MNNSVFSEKWRFFWTIETYKTLRAAIVGDSGKRFSVSAMQGNCLVPHQIKFSNLVLKTGEKAGESLNLSVSRNWAFRF